jgi:hypothetical protein
VTVTIKDDGAGTAAATVTSTATVAENDVLTGTAAAISATEGQAANSVTVATFTDSNPSAPASDFTASINWGDQQTSTGTVTLSNGVFSVTSSHTYADEGSYSVTVTIKDDGAGTATATVTRTATVAENDVLTGTAAAISATEGQAANGVTVATFTDSNPSAPASDFTASINWGDRGSFTAIWEKLSSAQQAETLLRWIERIDYDGASGSMAITFRADGDQCSAKDSAQAEKEIGS